MINQKSAPVLLLFGSMTISAILWVGGELAQPPQVPISPLGTMVVPLPTPTPTPQPPKPTKPPVNGLASYYSREGCIGCSKDLRMANGEPLDDNRLTIAYNYGKLNSVVVITNTKTGKKVTATVTDRGGFERHGKIADLSVATRDALGCGHVCSIELLPK